MRRKFLVAGAAWPALSWTGAARAQAMPPMVIGWLDAGFLEYQFKRAHGRYDGYAAYGRIVQVAKIGAVPGDEQFSFCLKRCREYGRVFVWQTGRARPKHFRRRRFPADRDVRDQLLKISGFRGKLACDIAPRLVQRKGRGQQFAYARFGETEEATQPAADVECSAEQDVCVKKNAHSARLLASFSCELLNTGCQFFGNRVFSFKLGNARIAILFDGIHGSRTQDHRAIVGGIDEQRCRAFQPQLTQNRRRQRDLSFLPQLDDFHDLLQIPEIRIVACLVSRANACQYSY